MVERVRRYPADGALAAAVAAVALVDAVLGHPGSPFGSPGVVVDYLLVLVASGALAVRRVWPRAVLVVAVGCVLAYGFRVDAGPLAAVPVLVALYTAFRAGHRWVAVVVVAPMVVAGLLRTLVPDPGQTVRDAAQQALLPVGWYIAAGVLGEVARHRNAYLRQVEQRAAEAERSREETALRRAEQERLRIARELHDSLTHSISVVKVQAGVAAHLAKKRGEDVPEALLAIQEASTDAMDELRATLEVLRDDEAANGVDRLPRLLEHTRAAGLSATLTVTGGTRPLPAAVDRAAYRVVQEALTNVTRHAGTTSAYVRVEYGPHDVTVEVDNDAGHTTADPAPATAGVGLVGMRERVEALGGRLRAEPREDGGFTVHAVLPTETSPSGPGAAP